MSERASHGKKTVIGVKFFTGPNGVNVELETIDHAHRVEHLWVTKQTEGDIEIIGVGAVVRVSTDRYDHTMVTKIETVERSYRS